MARYMTTKEQAAWERDQVAALDALVHEVSTFLHAPPLMEANRRASLIRRVLEENPE